jgi:hypothetical protein
VSYETLAVSAFPTRIGIFEVLPDVSQASGAEKRITKSMEDYITIRMRHDAPGMRNAHSTQHDKFAGPEGVDVDTLTYSHEKPS